jgi:hypothetical protein
MKRKPNPILDAIKFKGQGRIVILDWHKQPKDTQLDIIRQCFTSETIYEVGALVLGAVLSDDKQFPKIVEKAIKAGNHLFNRDRELVLSKCALCYTLRKWALILDKNHGNMQESVEELKAGIEQHCNRGTQLEQYQWTRLSRAFGLPKRSSVRRDRKAVKYFREVGELLDFAPPPTKKHKR